MLRASLALFGLLCAPAIASELSDDIDEYFAYCHEHGLFNGAVLVKHAGEVVYERAWGLADLRDGRPLDVDTAFYLASVSKQFTSMGALILDELDKLDLDDPLTRHVPELGAFADGVRLRHLMTHTAGIPDHFRLLQGAPAGLTNAQVLELLVEHGRLDFAPGSEYAYSNGGYVLLAMVIERAAGQPFGEFMREAIFEPLGMTRTLVLEADTPPIQDRAVGFAEDGALDDYALFTTGAGGMYTTVRDLSRWDDALHAGALVGAEQLERAFTPVRLDDGREVEYGFGWILGGGGRVVRHAGSLAGFRTVIYRDRQTRDAIVLLSNSAAMPDVYDFVAAVGAMVHGGQPRLPRIPVARVVRELLEREGLQAALERYDELWTEAGDVYDLGEEQLNGLGYACAEAGDLQSALAILARNCESFPRAFNTWDSLGEIQLRLGRRAEARASYRRSLELNPENTGAARVLEQLDDEG